MSQVSPHEFIPLKRLFNRGRCRACVYHEVSHPFAAWVEARAIGDKSLPKSVKG